MSSRQHSSLFVGVLFLIFFLSGISGLVYEVVWLRMLLRTFGVTIYAVSTVLTVFMSGLAIGALVIGRKTNGNINVLRWYAVVEILIGVTAGISTIIITFFPSWVASLTINLPMESMLLIVVRVVVAVIVLFPTTFLMGMTLPLMSGFFGRNQYSIGKLTGLLYSINTLGAVLGILITGFIGIYYLGEIGIAYVAVLINIVVGLMAFWMSKDYSSDITPVEENKNNDESNSSHSLKNKVLVIAGVSGFSALAFQVVWSRILAVILGNSVYAFSIMLSVYLIGISFGSIVLSRYVDRLKNPIAIFAMMEFAVVVFSITSLHTLEFIGVTNPGPDNIRPILYTYSPIWSIFDFWHLTFYSVCIILPVTFFFGASFPIACKLYSAGGVRTEKVVGKVYGYNTIGAIFGSFVTGFILIPVLGTQPTFILASVISATLAIYLFILSNKNECLSGYKLIVAVVSLVTVALVIAAPDHPFRSILKQKLDSANTHLKSSIIAHEEDKTATATMLQYEDKEKSRFLYINGLFVSNTSAMIGQILITYPLMFHDNPKKVLIIGLGVGESYKMSLKQGFDTTVVELVPPALDFFKRFDDSSEIYLSHPLSHIVIGDGRNFLLRNEKKLDYVIVDGSPPFFASGMVNLYSYDFAQLVEKRLNPGGIFAIWMPDICFADDIWMVTRNFADTFKNVTMFAYKDLGGVILMGSNAQEKIFKAPANVLADRLKKYGVSRSEVYAELLVNNLLFSEQEIRERSSHYPRVTDNYPYTEFPFISFLKGKTYHKNNQFLLER